MANSEIENEKHRVYNFALDALDQKCLLGKLDVVIDTLKWAPKLNVAFSFALENAEYGSCIYHYAQQSNTLMARHELVATREVFTRLKKLLSNTDFTESCTRDPANTKWKFLKLRSIKIFAALLKEFHMGCKDTTAR